MEQELGLKTNLNKDMIRTCNFVLKQIMPYYDRYTAPYFQGIDYDVVEHGMPGGATSSSQEGALKQGYIHLLPYMLKFLAGTRQIVRYHDVTPGSQITWNTAFLAVTGAFKRGGEREVRDLLDVLDYVVKTPEAEQSDNIKRSRLDIYRDANDAFRNLLLGEFGRLPLGFPDDWVYESAFGADYKKALARRTEESPLATLPEMNLDAEREALARASAPRALGRGVRDVLEPSRRCAQDHQLRAAVRRSQQRATGRVVRGPGDGPRITVPRQPPQAP